MIYPAALRAAFRGANWLMTAAIVAPITVSITDKNLAPSRENDYARSFAFSFSSTRKQ